MGYNGRGQLKRLALNNGLTTWYGYLGYAASGTNDAYDATWGQFGRLWRICTAPYASNRCTFANRDTTPVEQRLDLRYAYDNAGNVTTMRDYLNSNQNQNFGYDQLNRLTSAATGGVGSDQYSHSYVYNRLGNITNFAGTAYAYNSSKPHAVTHVGGVQRFWYDANGNMTKRIEGSVTYDPQVYDVQNRLVSVNRVGAGTTTFAYDAAGIRVKTVRPNGDIIYTPFRSLRKRCVGAQPSDAANICLWGRPSPPA
jgi:YD repeat-containing protein